MPRSLTPLKILVALALITGAVVGGSTKPPGSLLLASLSLLALAAAAVDGLRAGEPLRVPVFVAPILIAAACAAFQLVPLPGSARQWLTPVGTRSLEIVLNGVADVSGWRPLSLDPPATIHATARLLGLAALLIAMARAVERYGERWLRSALLATLCAVIIVVLAGAAGLPTPAAIMDRGATRAAIRFPFVNPNHAAIFFAALLPSLLALAVRRRGLVRAGLVALALLANGMMLATLSRAGIILGSVAQAIVIIILIFRDPRARDSKLLKSVAATVILATCGLAISIILVRSGAGIVHGPSRWQALHDFAPMVRDYWRVGVGHGAFQYVFPRYNSVAGATRFGFLENEYLQTVSELGVPATLLVYAAGLWAAWRIGGAWRKMSLRAQAALVGMAIIAAQNFVDFSWAAGGVAAIFCALTILTSVYAQRRWPVAAAFAIVVGGGALVILGSTPAEALADRDVRHLQLSASDSSRSLEEFVGDGVATFKRHPADGFTADVIAGRLLAARDTRALDWLNRALWLGPRDAVAHRLLARAWRMANRRADAAEEFRISLENDSTELHARWAELHALFSAREDAPYLIAAVPLRRELFESLVTWLAIHQQWETLEQVGIDAEQRFPGDPLILSQLVAGELQLKHAAKEHEYAAKLAQADPAPAAQMLAARALRLAGDPVMAERILVDELARSKSPEAAVALAQLMAARGDVSPARQLIQDALAATINGPDKAMLYDELAAIEDQEGNSSRAAVERAEARRMRDR